MSDRSGTTTTGRRKAAAKRTPRFRPQVKIAATDQGFIMLDGNLDDTIHTMKEKICKSHHIPSKNQLLLYQDEELLDGASISDYKIKGEFPIIKLRVKKAESQTLVNLYNPHMGVHLEWYVSVSDRVCDIKRNVQFLVNLAPGAQIYNYDGYDLQDYETLGSQLPLPLGLGESPSIQVTQKEEVGSMPSDLTTKTKKNSKSYKQKNASVTLKVEIPSSGQDFYLLDGSHDDTVHSVKERIHKTRHIPGKNQVLSFQGQVLSDGSLMSSYEIKDIHQPIQLTFKKSDSDSLFSFYNPLTGNTIQWIASLSDRVCDIKTNMQYLLGTLPAEQTYVCDGCCLQDYQTLGAQCSVGRDEMPIINVIHHKPSQVGLATSENYGLTIPQPELRGITLLQLRDVIIQILLRCQKQRWRSTYDSSILQPDQVTLYDLVHYYIKPVTEQRGCSYIETVATEPQKPEFFVSHWWGESVFNFWCCLERHAYDRNLSPLAPYWVCAYAVNQHDVGGDLGEDPRNSPFYNAMRLTRGTVSVLDKKSICYTRIWCAFEISIAIKDFISNTPEGDMADEQYLYDVYALSKDAPGDSGGRKFAVGLTDGFVKSDRHRMKADGTLGNALNSDYWMMNKMKRQQAFPLSLCRKALLVCLQEANASVELDKRRILNYISGETSDLTKTDPPLEHPAYDEINKLLRGKFAHSSYRAALEAEEDMKKYREALAGSSLIRLNMDWRACQAFKAEAPLFVKALPTCLKELDLDLGSINFSGDRLLEGLGHLTNTCRLKINLQRCGLENDSLGRLAEELQRLEALQELSLSLGYNKSISSVGALGQALESMKDLASLDLDMFCCNISSLDPLFFMGCSSLSKLTRLRLKFQRCHFENVQSLVEFAAALASSCTPLQDVQLYMRFNTKLKSIDGLGESLAHLPHLRSLFVDCGECKLLGNEAVVGMCKALVNGASPNLEKLNINAKGSCSPRVVKQLGLTALSIGKGNVKDLKTALEELERQGELPKYTHFILPRGWRHRMK